MLLFYSPQKYPHFSEIFSHISFGDSKLSSVGGATNSQVRVCYVTVLNCNTLKSWISLGLYSHNVHIVFNKNGFKSENRV
jgi:hypothetical protein